MKKILVYLAAMITILMGCTRDNPLESQMDLVVRGYLYAGEPVRDIKLSTTLPLGSEVDTAPPVNDAQVALLKNGRQYDLVPSPGDSGYYQYSGDDLIVESGDRFKIQVLRDGKLISAETTVPPAPQNLTLSAGRLVISSSFFPRPGADNTADSTRFLQLSWTEEANSLFYVVVENVEANPEAISSFGPGGGDRFFRMISMPQPGNVYRIQRMNVSYYGKHVAHVYRVNQEYADLYQSRNQDSRDLNEPLTNIQNGLGVFSAFASRSVTFEVVGE